MASHSAVSVASDRHAFLGGSGIQGPMTPLQPALPPLAAAMDDLERQVAHGSAAACLALADQLTGLGTQPQTAHTTTTADVDHVRAAMLMIAGIVWDVPEAAMPRLGSRQRWAATTRPSSTAVGHDEKRSTPDKALTCSHLQLTPLSRDLVQRLTCLLQRPSLATALPPTDFSSSITSTHHRDLLVDTLSSLGWSAGASSKVTLSVLASRLARSRLSPPTSQPAMKPSTRHLPTDASAFNGNDVDRVLLSLLGDLPSSSAALARESTDDPSLTAADTDSATNSSYPASPETQLRGEIDLHDRDDSPPTTPSHTSSSDELSKTYVPQNPALANILRDHAALTLNTNFTNNSSTASSSRSHSRSRHFPRTDTMTTTSSGGDESGVCTPSSRYSSRSTASSLFARFFAQPKSISTTSLHAEERSTMGSFTPVPAKTAVGSLRQLKSPEKRGWSLSVKPKIRSRLGMPERWEIGDDTSSSAGEDSSDGGNSPPSSSRPIARLEAPRIPSICMTHSSFKSEASVAPEISYNPTQAMASSSKARSPNYTVKPERSATAPVPSSSKVPRAAQSHSGAFPPLDPTFKALEKSSKLRNKTSCANCGTVGWDFPKNRNGQALCTRECRMAFKAREVGVAPPSVKGKEPIRF